ncbi:MAG: hypothetical protein QM791_10550 [Ferruginibacter sp.]
MLTVSSNISEVTQQVQVAIDKIKNPDVMLRTIASTLTGVIRKRVHEDGQASSGEQIGVYSDEYMKVRTGDFGNSSRVTRGKNKGNLKDAGVYTKGPDKGKPRPRYNRTSDTKVILSLTRQMENDMGAGVADPIKTESGYGIGFKNPHNYEKAIENEKRYKKPIWQLSAGEEQIVNEIANQFTQDAITGANS